MKIFKINSTQAIIGSFLIALMIGTFLLSLPIASRDRVPTDFLTCIFTATSSLCVTGLAVVDTYSHWSFFGQLIILILIQLGGLGVIVVISIIATFIGHRIDLKQRTTLQEALALDNFGGMVKLILLILNIVIAFEIIGAILLFTQFKKDFNTPTAIWYSVFHSISAFCNAGFDLMGIREKFSSLTYYDANVVVNVTIMTLIVFGGLGFSVWRDLLTHKFNANKYRLQTKIVLIYSMYLIILPAIYFYIFEYNYLAVTPRVLSSLFQSITTRTAGFNTRHFSNMTDVGKAISIVLMLIGGSPGSTAGGMKTTTFAVLIISTIAVYKRENEPHRFNRRITIQIIKNAITVFVMYVTLFLLSGFAICIIENTELENALFEVASAIGTVGLTLNFTTTLSNASRIILIILMFLGRVGGLTFIYSVLPSLNKEHGFIAENIAIG